MMMIVSLMKYLTECCKLLDLELLLALVKLEIIVGPAESFKGLVDKKFFDTLEANPLP